MQGLLLPTIPSASGTYVLSIIGGIGGSITMLSYNYWMREEQMSGAGWLGYVRGDVAIAYLFTAIFGMSIMLIANQAFYLAGVTHHRRASGAEDGRSPGHAARDRSASTPIRSASGRRCSRRCLGVWQSVPYLYADFYGVIRKLPAEARREVTKVTSTPYRLALAFITLAPLPFAFTGRPLVIIVIYTIVGSLFVPFLAATLLYLNNRVQWSAAGPAQPLDDQRAAGRDSGAVRGRRRAGGDECAVSTCAGCDGTVSLAAHHIAARWNAWPVLLPSRQTARRSLVGSLHRGFEHPDVPARRVRGHVEETPIRAMSSFTRMRSRGALLGDELADVAVHLCRLLVHRPNACLPESAGR